MWLNTTISTTTIFFIHTCSVRILVLWLVVGRSSKSQSIICLGLGLEKKFEVMIFLVGLGV